jgi:RNA polymerase sigma-70 factor (ECF subfamily)
LPEGDVVSYHLGMDKTPASLLERLRRPDEQQAWARFVELFAPLIYYWARRTGLQNQDAADLVQDVFLLLLRKLPEFNYDDHKSFRNWLRTVTLNRWRDTRRRRVLPLAAGAVLDELPGGEGVEALWEAEYQRHVVGQALEVMRAEFEPATWQACWGLVVEGRSAADVGRELGISPNAVYIAKCRVLQRLRQELNGLIE